MRIGGRQGGISSFVITSTGWTNFCVYFRAMDYGRTFLVGHTPTHLAMQKDARGIAGSTLLLVPYRLLLAKQKLLLLTSLHLSASHYVTPWDSNTFYA